MIPKSCWQQCDQHQQCTHIHGLDIVQEICQLARLGEWRQLIVDRQRTSYGLGRKFFTAYELNPAYAPQPVIQYYLPSN